MASIRQDVTVEDVIELMDRLKPADRKRLSDQLFRPADIAYSGPVTRESILIEHTRRLLAGELSNQPSLLGMFARPDLALNDEEIAADLHAFATEWEKELDDPDLNR